MLTAFETWLAKNRKQLPEESVFLFEDSLKCYKADIIRPAYLLGYQGMLFTIRETLKKGKVPEGFTNQEWANKISKINRESAWDDETIQLINTQANGAANPPKVAPLHMPNNVRKQFDYWRDLRNTCAHYKPEPFIQAHVLTLYSFIERWLLKISVTGGLAQMLDKIEKFCDPAHTSADSPWETIVEQIPRYIDVADTKDFIQAAVKIIIQSPHRKSLDFIYQLIHNSVEANIPLREEAIEFIKTNKDREEKYIKKFPDDVLIILRPDDVRPFWYEHTISSNPNIILAICNLIEAKHLSENDIEEFFRGHLRNLYNNDNNIMAYPALVISTFNKYGYFDIFFDQYMSENYINNLDKVGDICYKTNFYMSHIVHVNLDMDRVKRIVEGIGGNTTSPYTLKDRFVNEVMLSDTYPVFRDKLIELAQQNAINLPDNWKNNNDI